MFKLKSRLYPPPPPPTPTPPPPQLCSWGLWRWWCSPNWPVSVAGGRSQRVSQWGGGGGARSDWWNVYCIVFWPPVHLLDGFEQPTFDWKIFIWVVLLACMWFLTKRLLIKMTSSIGCLLTQPFFCCYRVQWGVLQNTTLVKTHSATLRVKRATVEAELSKTSMTT